MFLSFPPAAPALVRSASALLGAVCASTAFAAPGLNFERAGLGLREPTTPRRAQVAAEPASDILRVAEGSGYSLYVGARERSQRGLTATERFTGLRYDLTGGIAAALELSSLEATPALPRRLALSGRLVAPHGSNGSLSLGLAWRVYDSSNGLVPAAGDEPGRTSGYSLASSRIPGTGLRPTYQVQLQYRYSDATTFGLLVGRELETYTTAFDSAGSGLRQLSFSGRHWLSPSWALSYDLLSDDPGSLRVQGLRLGVRYRF